MPTIGMTGHAQELLGGLVFVELPGRKPSPSSRSKAASDVYAPVVETHTAVVDSPERISRNAQTDLVIPAEAGQRRGCRRTA